MILSLVHLFIPLRTLVHVMPVVLQRRTEMLILFPLWFEHRITRAAPVTDRSQLTSRYVSPLQSSVQMLIVRREYVELQWRAIN